MPWCQKDKRLLHEATMNKCIQVNISGECYLCCTGPVASENLPGPADFTSRWPHIYIDYRRKIKFFQRNTDKFWLGFLTHWDRVTHICVVKLAIIGSDNGLSPGRRQAIIWTNAGILLIGPLGTNFSEFLIVIHTFSFSRIHLKMSSAKWCQFCLDLNVLIWASRKLSLRSSPSCVTNV